MSVKKISDLNAADTLAFCDDVAKVQTAATKACLAIADKYGLDRRVVFSVFSDGVTKALEDDFFWEVAVPNDFGERKEG